MTRGPTPAQIAAAGLPLQFGPPPFILEALPLSLDTLDALIERYLPWMAGWVDFEREEITKGSVAYRMSQAQLGELGVIKIYKRGEHQAAMRVSGVPRPTTSDALPRGLKKTIDEDGFLHIFTEPGGECDGLTALEIDRKVTAATKELYCKRQEYQARVIQALFNRLAGDLTWTAAWQKLDREMVGKAYVLRQVATELTFKGTPAQFWAVAEDLNSRLQKEIYVICPQADNNLIYIRFGKGEMEDHDVAGQTVYFGEIRARSMPEGRTALQMWFVDEGKSINKAKHWWDLLVERMEDDGWLTAQENAGRAVAPVAPPPTFDQREQTVHGPQTNVAGNVYNFHLDHAEGPASGDGPPMVRTLFEEHPLRPSLPRFEEATGSVVVTLYATDLNKLVGEEEKVRWAEIGLSHRQIAVMTYLVGHGRITTRECHALLDVSERTARTELSKLVTRGLIAARGQGRNRHYILP